ncbi:MAG: DUF167 domain-containing protein [Gammaproteobacteria bacterium]|nr:DUF167 domain-containing protein [Sideroxydans sp.]MBU3903385.1 DUF167 domain-containing protein [Gammaproteobacteria bacterium]MBU4046575.1 DUF167 domain-containing protein [Gammaproteobacteria bacterium]
MDTFCQWQDETLVLNILGRPRAKQTKLSKGIGNQLEIHVAENPVRGRATAHLVKFLAGEFDVPVKSITVVFGVYSVNKQLRIKAPNKLPAVIAKRLNAASK